MTNSKKVIVSVICILLLCLVMHAGGMQRIISVAYPEKILTISDFQNRPGTTQNLDFISEGRIRTTSIASWFYIDYQSFGIERPVSLDYEIVNMDDSAASIPMYYVPSYFLQGIERDMGKFHVDLDYRTSQDKGLRLDFTSEEGINFEFGNFVINDTDNLTKTYLKWFDICVAYILFILLSCYISLCWTTERSFSDFQIALGIVGGLLPAILGIPIIGYVCILIYAAHFHAGTDKVNITQNINLVISSIIGSICLGFLCKNIEFGAQFLYSRDISNIFKNVFLTILTFLVVVNLLGIIKKRPCDFIVKLANKAIYIMLLYVILDTVLKGYANSYITGQWLEYLRCNMFSTATIVNLLVLWAGFFAFSAILNIIWAQLIYAIMLLILSIGNAIKLHFHGSLLQAADFFVLKEALGIAGQYIAMQWFLLLAAILVGALVLGIIKRKQIKKALKVSVNGSAICFIPMMVLIVVLLHSNILVKAGIDPNARYKQEKEALNAYGTGLYYYYMLAKGTSIAVPDGYGESIMEEVAQYKDQEFTESDIKPNVILLLAESLFRADEIPDVNYNENLFENTQEYICGTVISPSYGGRTAVAEAEALTGYSSYFLDGDAYIYNTYLTSPQKRTGSLAREFAANGYTTWAMHPNRANFYNRDIVYQCMGFDRFFSIDDYAVEDEDLLGDGLVKDRKFFDFLIQKLEETSEPLFIFGATIEGHSPYESKFKETDIRANSNVYNSEELQELSEYAQTVKDLDTQLGRLFEYLDTCEKPTLVYVFGDHLPPIKVNSSDGFLDNNDTKYGTPLIIYSNYKEVKLNVDKMSLSQLAPQIIMDSGIPHSTYFDFLYSFRDEHPILHKDYPIEEDDAVKLYEKIQYDGLAGERYLLPK